MQILIANHRLDRPAGTETYVHTLTERLLALGHEVTCYAPRLGLAAGWLRDLGAQTVDDPRDAPRPDVMHLSHLDAGHLAMAAWPLAPAVFVVHGNGTRAVVERPPLWRDAVEVWVAVAGHVADVMTARDGIARNEIEIVPNLIDLRRFVRLQPPHDPVRTVLLHSNHHDGPLRETLGAACDKLGAALRIVGGARRQLDLVSEVNHADAVVAIGRSALEAMACGRPALLYSAFGGDGLCCPETAERDLEYNYSGLAERTTPDAALLADELSRAGRELGAWSRRWVEARHDSELLVPRLTDLYQRAIARGEERRRRLGTERLLAERFGGFYPSLRWWHRAPDLVDWDRATTPFPVWAPDADDELPVLLGALRGELEAARAETAVARAETEAARVEAAAAEAHAARARGDSSEAQAATRLARSETEAIRSTRTWRAHDRLFGSAIVRRYVQAAQRRSPSHR